MAGKSGSTFGRWFGIIAGIVVLALAWTERGIKPIVKYFLTACGSIAILSHWSVIATQFRKVGKQL